MPLPMVHLTVAITMAGDLTEPWVPAFLLGNLAPDAIHTRPGWTGDHKRHVHLHLSSTDVPEGAEAVARDLLRRWRQEGICIEALHVGYVAHLLTDLLWRSHVWLPLRRTLPAEMSHEQGRALYYHETDEIDRQIYATAPWRTEVWELLAAARPVDVPDMVTAQEIELWRQRTLEWFDHLAPAQKPPQHLTTDGVLSFAEQAANQVLAWLDGWGFWPPPSQEEDER